MPREIDRIDAKAEKRENERSENVRHRHAVVLVFLLIFLSLYQGSTTESILFGTG